MSKPLIITADQSMTSTSTLNTTSNTSDSNENHDLEKRRRAKPETIVEGQALSSSDGELSEAERARLQLQRVHQDITERYGMKLDFAKMFSTNNNSAPTAAACVIIGISGAPKPACWTTMETALVPIATGTDPDVSRTPSPQPVICADTDRTTVADSSRTRHSR